MIKLVLMPDASEIVPYDNPVLPLHISLGELNAFPERKMLCHWHDDIELISVISGNMYYRIDEHTVLLRPGDTVLVNSRRLHYGYAAENANCRYYCTLCHPELLAANKLLYQQYLAPILENADMQYVHLTAGEEISDTVFGFMRQIYLEKEEAQPGYELTVIGLLQFLWRQLLPLRRRSSSGIRDYTDETLQKDMVSFIHKHYAEHITLSDIAAAGHVCQNKCCVLFRRYMQQSPIDFLNAYRLEVSCHLLQKTRCSISQIAQACGFNHLSYYSKLFQRKYGCTPTQWRTTHPATQ